MPQFDVPIAVMHSNPQPIWDVCRPDYDHYKRIQFMPRIPIAFGHAVEIALRRHWPALRVCVPIPCEMQPFCKQLIDFLRFNPPAWSEAKSCLPAAPLPRPRRVNDTDHVLLESGEQLSTGFRCTPAALSTTIQMSQYFIRDQQVPHPCTVELQHRLSLRTQMAVSIRWPLRSQHAVSAR